MRLVIQYTRWKAHHFADVRDIREEHWKTSRKLPISDDLSPEGVKKMMGFLKGAVEETTYYGVSEAYWRLALVDGAGATKVLTEKGYVNVPVAKPVVLSPIYMQGSEVDIEDHAFVEEATGQVREVDLELDSTPVPHGTVVQILDEWGDPVQTTEVI